MVYPHSGHPSAAGRVQGRVSSPTKDRLATDCYVTNLQYCPSDMFCNTSGNKCNIYVVCNGSCLASAFHAQVMSGLHALSLGGKKKKKKPKQQQRSVKNSFGKELTSTSKKALRQYKSLGSVTVVMLVIIVIVIVMVPGFRQQN